MKSKEKPLGRRNYGHIAHLPESRLGPGDHKCHEGQARIATEKARDRHDEIIVQEKLDGSNVGVARMNGEIYPLGRAGYPAQTSPYVQHKYFYMWAWLNRVRFLDVLDDGERLVGEWMMQAHGTRYYLFHEPFVAFDLMKDSTRMPYDDFMCRMKLGQFITPQLLHRGSPLEVWAAMDKLGDYGFHGALDFAEGAVWRVERNRLIDRKKGGSRRKEVDFLCKFVHPDKVDGQYLDQNVWNENIFDWLDIKKEGE